MQSLWMLFASFMFAIMGVCVKIASDMYSTSEIVMYRGIIGITVMTCTILYQGDSFKTGMWGQHLWRGVVGVIALWLWFYAIAILPLATAMTLNYMAPIWIAVILLAGGWWRATKQVEWPLVAAIAMSFVGVTLLLQPVFETDQAAGAITALISGMLSALAYLQVRKLGLLGEPEYRVVFFFSLTTAVVGLLATLAGDGPKGAVFHAHTPYSLLLLAGIGAAALMAQMAMTRAYRVGKVLVVANLQYTGIVFSCLWGLLLWNDTFDWHVWLGMGIILAS